MPELDIYIKQLKAVLSIYSKYEQTYPGFI